MKKIRFLQNQVSRVKVFGFILMLSATAAFADCCWLICSDVINHSHNTCDDSCPSPPGCTGVVYDYQNNGNLSCTLIDKACGTEGAGQLGFDCKVIGYYVPHYSYGNAAPSCPPCIRQYVYQGPILINDVLTRDDADCVPE
jgi:hypothetical protein